MRGARRLAEVHRILKPDGRVQLHILTADRPLAEANLALPGPAAAVQHVPVDQEVLDLLTSAGFTGAHYAYRGASPCFVLGQAELRETKLEAAKP